MVHPLFGLFAEPASTMIVTTDPNRVVSAIEKLAGEYSFFAARIGTTGGPASKSTVDREPFISASARRPPLFAKPPCLGQASLWKPLSTTR
jgi:hypothetical protein